MRLQQVGGRTAIPKLVRSRLENSDFFSAATAQHALQRQFPNHVVCREEGEIAVKVKDRSFSVAVFKEVY